MRFLQALAFSTGVMVLFSALVAFMFTGFYLAEQYISQRWGAIAFLVVFMFLVMSTMFYVALGQKP